MNIIVADDDLVTLKIVSGALEDAGHSVRQARNGTEAQKLIRESRPDVVFTDWNMPECNGLELCRWVRSVFSVPYVYIIVITARRSGNDAVQALSEGADDFVRKPIEAAEIVARARAAERILALESRQVTIRVLAKLAESRDPETGEHLERVSAYVQLVYEGLAIHSPYLEEITSIDPEALELASCLHDIGKVGIPDSVLLKPGRLTDEEFEIMKEHTTIGANAIESSLGVDDRADFLTMARDIALTHHERWDGTGYPNGLAGLEIPLVGRIMAVADIYDAMTTPRVYRGAMDHDDVVKTVVAERGKQLDPVLVDVFSETTDQFKAILERNGASLDGVTDPAENQLDLLTDKME